MGSDQLKRRGYLGLSLGSAAVAGQGLPVRGVAPGSSAAGAGVRAGDLLTHLDQNPTLDLAEVRLLLRALCAGEPLELQVLREGQPLALQTEVAAFPLEQYVGARCVLDQVACGEQRLRALWVRPDGPGPFPVVYYLPGAHWASEEYPLTPTHPVPSLLGALASAGIASLRVERSGVGDSRGPDCRRLGYDQELAGYAAGLQLLQRTAWADPERLFLFGHSLGAMHAPQLAGRIDVRGILVFGAGAIPISGALVGAIRRHAELQLGTDPRVRARGDQIAELIRLVVAGGQTPAQVFAQRPDLQAVAPDHFRNGEAYQRDVRFYHELQARDVAGAYRRYHGKLLALHGGRDYIASAADAHAIAALAGGPSQVQQLQGVDHHMSDAPTGSAPRLAPACASTIVQWLLAM